MTPCPYCRGEWPFAPTCPLVRFTNDKGQRTNDKGQMTNDQGLLDKLSFVRLAWWGSFFTIGRFFLNWC